MDLRFASIGTLVLAALICLAPLAAHAQRVSTFEIDFPGILILRCESNIAFNASTAVIANFFVGNGATGDDAFASAGATATVSGATGVVTASLSALPTSLARDPSNVSLLLAGVCDVRGVGKGNGVDVSVALTGNTTLSGPGSSQISVTTVGIRRNDLGGAFVSSFNIPESDLGFGTFVFIDAALGLDLSQVNQAGNHSSPVDGTFQVTVTFP